MISEEASRRFTSGVKVPESRKSGSPTALTSTSSCCHKASITKSWLAGKGIDAPELVIENGPSIKDITIAQLAIITNENTPHEKQRVIQVPIRAEGELTLVKSFVYS